eukprot:30168-Pelagococcus_subviridis.AAC.3
MAFTTRTRSYGDQCEIERALKTPPRLARFRGEGRYPSQLPRVLDRDDFILVPVDEQRRRLDAREIHPRLPPFAHEEPRQQPSRAFARKIVNRRERALKNHRRRSRARHHVQPRARGRDRPGAYAPAVHHDPLDRRADHFGRQSHGGVHRHVHGVLRVVPYKAMSGWSSKASVG